ncbi:hypothetical protein, partial [Kitasatospora sp. NPDC093102]|uniref:hypothetical protein n=1 Tax=Kitasatospora sp. NPDC093102 TaxID=3155069 RepID=UPI00342A853B
GMSTYLALTFGTLLSSQGTDASFGPPSSGPSRLRSFVFPAYQTLSAPFTGAFCFRPAGAFQRLAPCPTFQTLADPRSEKRIRPQSDKTNTPHKDQAGGCT